MWVLLLYKSKKKKKKDLPFQCRCLHFIHYALTVTEVQKESHKSLWLQSSCMNCSLFFIYLTLFNLTDFNELWQSEEINDDCFK